MNVELQNSNVEGKIKFQKSKGPTMNGGAGRHEEPERRFDLEERTARFGEAIIAFARRIPVTLVTQPIIPQLVRSATSVGAIWSEADDAGSKKEFRYRISICKREARETKHWLRMVVAAAAELKDEARPLWQEAKELNLIFAAIYRGKKSNGEPRLQE